MSDYAYSAATCPRCKVHAIMWHDSSGVLCPACGPVERSPRAGYDEVLTRLRALSARIAEHEAATRRLNVEIADVMQLVTGELWLALIRPDART